MTRDKLTRHDFPALAAEPESHESSFLECSGRQEAQPSRREGPPRLFKSHEVRHLASKVAFNYEDLFRECEGYLERARRQARQTIDEAATQAETIRRRALDEAEQIKLIGGPASAEGERHDQARPLADPKMREQLKTASSALRSAAEALAIERERWLAEWEKAAIQLSVAIAEKLIRHELSRKPEISTETLIKTLELAAGQPGIRVRINPDDKQLLDELPEEALRNRAFCGDATFLADDSISRGGCVVETEHGVIDAQLETQLKRLTSELLPRNNEDKVTE